MSNQPRGTWRVETNSSKDQTRVVWTCEVCKAQLWGIDVLRVQTRMHDHWKAKHPDTVYSVRAVVKCDTCCKMATSDMELKVPDCTCAERTGDKLKLELHVKGEPRD